MQAMDRCHRIGQQKPVLVFRLATALSVEGKLLRRANSKLALERLVIKKGAFLPGQVCCESSVVGSDIGQVFRKMLGAICCLRTLGRQAQLCELFLPMLAHTNCDGLAGGRGEQGDVDERGGADGLAQG